MWFEQVLFFIAGDRGAGRRARRRAAAQPVLLGARAGRAPARAGRAVPAAARRVPRRRAGRRLRGRGDGALHLRGRLRRRRRTSRCGPRAGCSTRSGRCSRRRSASSCASPSSPAGWRRSTRSGADVGAGFGSPGAIGQLLLTRFLVPFEAASYLLLIAAVGAVVLAGAGAGSRRSSSAPRQEVGAADPRRAARTLDDAQTRSGAEPDGRRLVPRPLARSSS